MQNGTRAGQENELLQKPILADMNHKLIKNFFSFPCAGIE
jgi:hypothetical protein